MGVKLDSFKEFLIHKVVPYVLVAFLSIVIVTQYLHISTLQREVEFLSKRTRLVVIDVVKLKKGHGLRVDTIKNTIKVDK